MLAAHPTLDRIDALKLQDEPALLRSLSAEANLSADERAAIVRSAAELVAKIRADGELGLMEVFLAEYGLSTEEGIALMCLAEALLRVPDDATIDDLIEDKIVPHDWDAHRGHSTSPLVNTSTIGLALTGKVLSDKKSGLTGIVRGAVKRLGEPVIRAAVAQGMREMGRQFVLGETIRKAMDRAEKKEAKGFTYSYDMLGEAAMTAKAATHYHKSYADTIDALASACTKPDMRDNPGVSVKLSALHPRYETAKEARVLAELVPAVKALAVKAKAANMNLAIDAEEADRLILSLQVIEKVLEDEALADWDGFGIVVQAYSRRAGAVLDWLHDLAKRLNRRITIRLVKGAYWDAEIKHAQVLGLPSFPVFTRKVSSDVSYIANARKLLGMTDHVYPQFATHNAHTMAAVLEMATGLSKDAFEFQRLHGMGEKLHDIVKQENGTRCRIYAPVGAHRDLLAYLVRRLLENGANSSFVNQIVDKSIAPEDVVSCPFAALEAVGYTPGKSVTPGPDIFSPSRRNSAGHDISSRGVLSVIETARNGDVPVNATSQLATQPSAGESVRAVNPATGEAFGTVTNASPEDVEQALAAARSWTAAIETRAAVLNRAADLYEANTGAFFNLLAREAGKTLADAVGEVREAVDFLRYYADQAAKHAENPKGIFTCISPWNFPLAIFSGQIAAALATGNGVLAKPAEQTPLIAALAVKLLHEAGVPREVLQLVLGKGSVVGAALTSDARVSGVAFTGSTQTALNIRKSMAVGTAPDAPLIAETGGLNAMIIDSTALPEQAARDVCASAFQSAGQRCSALRCLYVQEDIAEDFITMLQGIMDEYQLGNPWELTTDIGPVIDKAAKATIDQHVETARKDGRLIKQLPAPETGHFVGPALIKVSGIRDLEREIFGPVLHVATYRAEDLEKVIGEINSCGYGLTFGLHSRITKRVKEVSQAVHAGNIYVNRNQIGAVVGSQPFGGEGLSGTGPKAGGPNYLPRFKSRPAPGTYAASLDGGASTTTKGLEKLLKTAPPAKEGPSVGMPGPTGESNILTRHPREPVLCLGPGADIAAEQVRRVQELGGTAIAHALPVDPAVLTEANGFSGVMWWGDVQTAQSFAQALANRNGPILPLIGGLPDVGHVAHERHVCIDTTAAGGNAALLVQSAQLAGKS
ncbi:bifunctional proline dehydrogenase/L-glutamate gamma-semialdehyde dehydrogenase PutA [Roseibium litorale]|uniref:Bifunctional protein PutA n=1 Tax=Roseibium litorale TaxID=2803841 RepID=A0ABR9CK99_9HYPH|nr:bifunctional proline dehydrogenase/L-glutamate gamma-semialdehyde dehydrogenase PutA [Roseibium litorale]MBD8891183.1 bifunctional proline dehydrogenase/L-glutamate gamma-semialdehyde dehydrogenase PutA [Roseibium litorale]